MLRIICILFLFSAGVVHGQITVTYPQEGQEITARDKTYIMGTVSPANADFSINSIPVSVHSSGSFLAVLPIKKGDFAFRCRAVVDGKKVAELVHSVKVTRWSPPAVTATNTIETHSFLPAVSCGAIPGEKVVFRCKTKSGKRVVCTVGDDSSTVTFSLREKGRTGVYEEVRSFAQPLRKATIKYSVANDLSIKSYTSPAVLTVQKEYPCYVVTADTMQVKARDAASYNGDYTSFLTTGAFLKSSGFDGEWVRLILGGGRFVFVRSDQVDVVSAAKNAASNVLTDIIITETPTKIIAYLRGLSACNSEWVKAKDNLFSIRLFKTVASASGEVLITSNSRVMNVNKVNGRDFTDVVMTLDFEPCWGRDIQYENGYGILTITKPLTENAQRKITVCVDPGHGGDESGAIGPGGLKEKDATLAMGGVLAKKLEDAGYSVVVTRDSDVKVPIYDRPAFAKRHDADLFISIHYNACPDGCDPFARRGLESYYYYPSGKKLAAAIHDSLKQSVSIKDNGVLYKSLVVCRNHQIPSCLLELDYISIPDAQATIMTLAYQKRLSEAIIRGLNNYLKRK